MWSDIQTALKARLEAVSGMGKVYDHIVESDEAPGSTAWNAMFTGPNNKANFWMFTKNATTPQMALSLDSDKVYTKRSSCELQGFYAYDPNTSEGPALTLFESVMENLALGDRTFGGKCHTHQIPQVQEQDAFINYNGVTCHAVRLLMPIEELIVNPSVTDTNPPEDPIDAQAVVMDEISNALVAFVRPYVVGTVVPTDANFYVARAAAITNREDLVYPANPRVDLPRIRLRVENCTISAAATQAGTVSDFQFQGSFWLQQRQTPGQNHQRLLMQGLKRISAPFLGRFQPAQILNIPHLQAWTTVPATTNVYDDLRHEWDDPTLRVSVGQVQVLLTGRVRTMA